MPSKPSPEVEDIRRTLSEIQRLAGSLAESDRQRPPQRSVRSTELVALNVRRNEGQLQIALPEFPDVSTKTRKRQPSPLIAAGALGGLAVVAGLGWLLAGPDVAARFQTARTTGAGVIKSDAGGIQTARIAAGSAASTAVTVGSQPAAAAIPTAQPADVAAVEPTPARLLPNTATQSRDGAGNVTQPQSAAWQRTALTVSSLLATGRVTEARVLLLKADPEMDPDAAWALARTFDPRYVAQIPAADATPDVAQATHWYRKWHGLALAAGRISADVNIERILRGMD